MTDYRTLERALTDSLRLARRPVAVAFRPTPPAGVPAFSGVQPSGCSFWKLAADGEVFSTVGADHQNCPIGAHTHNIPLPPERAAELTDTLGFMASIGYLRMEEVPAIPRLASTPAAVVYAPLGETPVDPDVVLFWGPPGDLMLLQEAAIRAGVAAPTGALGRPTCMALPAALEAGVVASMGCIGNRVYTGLDASEMYMAVPAQHLARLADELLTIQAANATLHDFHRERSVKLRST